MKLALTVVFIIACSSTIVGCSDDVCDAAYDKMMSCLDQQNCNTLAPAEYSKCRATYNLWIKYQDQKDLYLTACSQDDSLNAEAKKVADCQLDPRSCLCP